MIVRVFRLRSIPGFPTYLASEDGEIWRKGRALRARSNGRGYLQVTLSRTGKKVDQYVHRLVCQAFHGPAPEGHECRHLNGKRDDNRADNLCWSTKGDNEADKQIHGTSNKGMTNGCAILTDEMVLAARDRAKAGEAVKTIAKEFGVNAHTLGDAVMGRKWTHLPGALPAYSTRRRFSEDQVREIRSLTSTKSYRQIAQMFGATENTIRQIATQKSYAHVVPREEWQRVDELPSVDKKRA